MGPRRVPVRTARVLAEGSRELHLDGAAAGDHARVLEEAARVHDRVVQRSLRLGDELLGAAAEDAEERQRLTKEGIRREAERNQVGDS